MTTRSNSNRYLIDGQVIQRELIPPKEAAALLTLSVRTIYNMIKDGTLKAIHLPCNGPLRVYSSEIERLLRGNQQ